MNDEKELETKEQYNDQPDVPFVIYEAEMARAERHIKRLWISLIVAIGTIVLVTAGFLYYLSLFDYESYEVVAEGNGHANYIGQDGDIYNNGGESLGPQESAEE